MPEHFPSEARLRYVHIHVQRCHIGCQQGEALRRSPSPPIIRVAAQRQGDVRVRLHPRIRWVMVLVSARNSDSAPQCVYFYLLLRRIL